LTHVPLVTALGCSNLTPQGPLAQFCPQDSTAGSGNLERPSSVAIARTGGDSGTAYAVVVNPDIRQARAVDLTHGLMVPAPAVYFPMAVKLGAYTEDVAVSGDGTVAVALDASDTQLRFFAVGPVSDHGAWRTVGALVDVDVRPTGLAVHGTRADLLVVVSHAGDPTGSLTILRWADGVEVSRSRVEVPGRPSDVGLTEDGAVVVVPDATGSRVTVVEVAGPVAALPYPDCAEGRGRPCTVDVGGPTADVAVGSAATFPFGPRYPVALALRTDKPVVAVLRLQTDLPDVPRQPHDGLEASVWMPRQPVVAALGPDPSPPCCTGSAFEQHPEALADGGYAYAVVATVDGTLFYLDLGARDATGRRTPRLIDRNPDPPGPWDDTAHGPLDVNSYPGTYQEPGRAAGESSTPSLRPVVTMVPTGDAQGDPAVVMQDLSDDYVFTWEGFLPGVSWRRAHLPADRSHDGVVQDDWGLGFAAWGVRSGDVVEVFPDDEGEGACRCPVQAPACASVASMVVTSVEGSRLVVAPGMAPLDCLRQDRGFAYGVRAAGSFVVNGSGRSFGRVGFFEPVDLPGMRVELEPANWLGGRPGEVVSRDEPVRDTPASVVVAGAPPRGTTLVIPLRANFDPFRLEMDDVATSLGRYLPAGAIPTGLATAVIPVVYSTGTSKETYIKAVGVLATAGGGLVLLFDLAVHGTGANGELSRSNADSSFRFFE
jgi:hypothetical protein